MNKSGIIYLASNINSNKKYVGQTFTTLTYRKNKHKSSAFKYDSQLKFHQALRKYGWNMFKWEVIEIDVELDLLDERETYWIEYHDSFNCGYNMTMGGCSSRGYHHTEETKEKLRNGAKGKSNLDHYIKRFGEIEGVIKYEIYMNTLKERKGKSRLQCFIEKHGDEEGKIKYDAFVQNLKDKKKGHKANNTLDYYISKLGEEKGKERYLIFSNKMKNKKDTNETKLLKSEVKKLYWKNKKGGT